MDLATKYRPKTFDEVLGQEAVVHSLRHNLSKGQSLGNQLLFAKVYLFIGPSGVGKTTLARLVADLLCGGQAKASNLVEENAAEKSGKDNMTDVVSKAQYRAIGASPNKIVILDECHRLSIAAWNSLLKPMEEPPPHVYWCLCTTEIGKIPETVKSRCVTYNLKPVDDLLIYDLLMRVSENEGFKVTENILEIVAEESKGSPRLALKNLELCLAAKNVGEARELMRAANEAKEPVDLARLLIKGPNSWVEVTKLIRTMGKFEAESVRIGIARYFSGCVMNAKTEDEAKHFLFLLDCFSTEYRASDGMAPLLLSVGMAIGLNQ